MSQNEVQAFVYNSTAGYVCWPKVVGADRTWDPRPDSDWTLTLGQTKQVDLISDAGFNPGDVVTAAVDVEGGSDASCNQPFTVTSNGNSASFTAVGTLFGTGLNYDE